MKPAALALAAALGLACVGIAQASEKLAQANACTACHANEKKPGMLGPAFKDIAAKYRGTKDAEALLIKKVKSGGQGVWGSAMMPPNAHVKDDDIKAMVQWILAMK